jgi:glycosyltransferase involved in cell wall biosynthesis
LASEPEKKIIFMRIFIPFTIKDIGGTSTFTYQFAQALKKRGYSVDQTFSWSFDILFIIADCPLRYPFYAKLLGKKVVQRLDGIYHPAVAGKKYWLYNLKMKIIHRYFADRVIYQSQFSKDACELFLGKTQASTSIIYNGVDEHHFTPATQKTLDRALCLITYAKFRRRDQIIPLIEAVKLLNPEDFIFDIYGSFTPQLQEDIGSLPANIFLRGKVAHQELPEVIRNAHIFLFSDQSACPNSVIEALASGLPVVAYNRGSIPELIKTGYNGKVIDLLSHNPFVLPYPFQKRDYESFALGISQISADLREIQFNTKKDVLQRFTYKKMIDHYIQLLCE